MTLLVRRGKDKYPTDFNHRDVYQKWVDDGGENVEYRVHRNVCMEVNELLLNEVIFKNYTIHMPFRLGELNIFAVKPDGKKQKMVDWKRTHEYWMKEYGVSSLDECKNIENKKYFYYLNEHTDGKYLDWWWNRSAVKNIRAYTFKPVRTAMRMASAYVQKIGEMPYYELSRSEKRDMLKKVY